MTNFALNCDNLDDWNELDTDQLRALGLVTFWSGRVEIELGDLTAELIAPSQFDFQLDPIAEIVISGMPVSAMIELANRLNHHRNIPEYSAKVKLSIEVARAAIERRNQLIHGTWLGTGKPGQATVLTRKRTGLAMSDEKGASEIVEVAMALADAQKKLYGALISVRDAE